MSRYPRAPRVRAQRGFSLLEMMVAVVIGMFSVVVILQVLSGTATSRRIAIGGGDAQLNAVAALRALELDVEHAGLGLQSFNVSGCGVSYLTTDGSAVTLSALAPVVINPPVAQVPAGDANTDTLLVISGNSGSPSEGDAVTAATSASSYVVTTPASFAIGDQVVAAPSTRAGTCALQVASVSGNSGSTLTVSNGAAGLPSGSVVYNLGGAPVVRAYAVRNGELTVCDYVATHCGLAANASSNTVWVPIASNVVSLRAQYARDTSGITGSVSAMDGVVDLYDQTTPGSDAAVTIPLYCKWVRVLGVRLAVVARNQQYDKTLAYTGSPSYAAVNLLATKTILPVPSWDGALTATTNPTPVPITLTATNWDHYRYNTIQTMVPLRNAIWQGGQPTYQGGTGAC